MKICVVTGTRAEYGLLKPLLKLLKEDSFFDLKIIATCMHLSPEFGLTIQEIEQDGFVADEKIECLLSSDTPVGTCKSMGLAMISFSDALVKMNPDLMILLGDRFEIFSVAATAHVLQIPIAHIHGGELTESAIDDAFRHSITKMSHLHFATTDIYKRRILQLGENVATVFNVGALGLDNIVHLNYLTKEELAQNLKINFQNKILLITYHPTTLSDDSEMDGLSNLLKVLKSEKGTTLIFTKANADAGGRKINSEIEKFISQFAENAYLFSSLGVLRYLSLMKLCNAVIGNSSSGIIEAPCMNIGTINIGDRQKGREKADSIIDCNTTSESIKKSLQKLYSPEFQTIINNTVSPYGNGQAAEQIISILKTINLSSIKSKSFSDYFSKDSFS